MHKGKRWRMRVDDFALLRGAPEPVISKQTAELVWGPKFLAEIVAGGDPRRRKDAGQPEELTVAAFLDRYYAEYVEAEGLKSIVTIRSQMKALNACLGPLPVIVLERPAEIARFKAEFRKGRKMATVNRALGTLRAAINWARFQDPPLLALTPFHRFGVNIRVKDETKRDRRLHRDAEGDFQDSFKTAWESLVLVANGHDTTRAKPGSRVDRAKLSQIDLHWHDLRHEGASRLLADGVDIRIIQLMLGHSDIKTTQRYLNITDEELRKALTGVWERRRQLLAVSREVRAAARPVDAGEGMESGSTPRSWTPRDAGRSTRCR